MKKNFFSQAIHIFTTVVRVALYVGNVAALGALGVKTFKLWTDKAFDLQETMKAFPAEPEFADFPAAERQIWHGIGFETFVFVIGGFLCYEFFIKPKSVRLRLIAPFVAAFLVLTGESVNLFLPALDKAHEIETCQMQGIPWSVRRHECDFMELERRRMERMLAAKKPVKARKKAAAPKTAASKAAPLPVKEAVIPAPAAEKPAPKPAKPAAKATAAKPAIKAEPKPEAKPAAKPEIKVEPKPLSSDGQKAAAPAAKQKPRKRPPVKASAAKPEPKPAEQALPDKTLPDKPAKKLAPPKSLAP